MSALFLLARTAQRNPMHAVPPAEMAGQGLDWPAVHAVNPRLVECSISRFGQTGPYRDYKGYELTSANAGGWATVTGAGAGGEDLPPLVADVLVSTGMLAEPVDIPSADEIGREFERFLAEREGDN